MDSDVNTKQGFERLFLQMETPLTNVLYRYLWNKSDVQDCIQSVFVKLWEKRHKVDWERAENLVYRMAINNAKSRLRKKKSRLSAIFPIPKSENKSPLTELVTNEEEKQTYDAINGLSEKLRSVLLLSLFSGLDYERIGGILNVPAGTVASRKNQAIKNLKEKISQEFVQNHA